VLLALLAALKYIARISKNKALNRFFHNIHIPFGILFLGTSLLHGFFAGNAYGTELKDFVPASLLFTWNAGTISLLIGCLLGISYLLRKKLKKNWMIVHRILTVLLICTVAYHLFTMGITLPGHLLNKSETGTESATTAATIIAPDTETEQAETVGTDASATTVPTEKATTEPDTEPTATETVEVTEDTQDEQLSVTFSGAVLKDGVYTGSADGFKGAVTVQVTVENGAVTDVEILSNYDTLNYFTRAKEIISSIIGGQTLEVDGISGATYSSKGIRDAVYNALKDAVVEGELSVSTITVHGGGKKH